VTERVVDHLELVEVDEEHRHPPVVPPRPQQRLGEAVQDEYPVG
jgi:hypothetical protein